MGKLDNKIAIVTGGARGIGEAISLKLASEGAKVAIVDILLDVAQATAEKFAAMGYEAKAYAANVAKVEEADATVKQVIADFGRVDILVNNAGITKDNLIMRMSEDEWDAVIAVNLKGTFNFTKSAVTAMARQRSGKIVNIASVVGRMGNAGQANYSASKAGVIALTKSTAKEFGARNVQVNAVAPGFIETEMTAKLPQSVRDTFMMVIPAKRPGKPEDVANVVAFLCSSDADYVTGQVLNIDGGMLM